MYVLGVRKCNAQLVQDSKAKLSQLIYGRNHPIYQNILYQSTLDDILMPKDLRDVLIQFLSGSRTMTIEKCQGGDALLEEINKETK